MNIHFSDFYDSLNYFISYKSATYQISSQRRVSNDLKRRSEASLHEVVVTAEPRTNILHNLSERFTHI